MERRGQPPAGLPASRLSKGQPPRHREPHLFANLVAGACQVFIGVGAVYGGLKLLRDPGEFGLRLEWLQDTPFADYSVPALFLFWILGAGMLVAASATMLRFRGWPAITFLMGWVLAAWLVALTVLLGYRGAEHAVLLAVAGIPALLMIVAGASAGGLRRSGNGTHNRAPRPQRI